MSFLVHDNPYCEDPYCTPNKRPEHWTDEDNERHNE